MNELALARVIHLLGVVLWIGGVAMITTILLPTIAKMPSAAEKIEFFEHIENRFATQARLTTLITGLSGFLYGAHTRCLEPLHRTTILVDACHGYSVAAFYADAIRFGATGIA